MDMQMLDDQLELIYNSSVWTQDIVYKTCRKCWMMETNGEKESRKSVLVACHDNDEFKWVNAIIIIISRW